jgi:hypothetical protein
MFGIPLPYQIAAVAFLVVGAFSCGYLRGSARADAEIARAAAEAQAQIAELQTQQATTNTQIVTKYVDRVRTVLVEKNQNAQLIANLPTSSLKLPNRWVYLHDVAATGGNADTARAVDAASSPFTDNDALRAVSDNYSTCRQNASQLEALQQWIRDTQKNVEEVNSK